MGSRVRKWIKEIYSYLTAQVKVNGSLSAQFKINNGTRQGCPLSPVIFAMTLEPFLQSNQTEHKHIKGLQIKNLKDQKLATYADDILLYVTEPKTSLPNTIKKFEKFKVILNFLINVIKTE